MYAYDEYDEYDVYDVYYVYIYMCVYLYNPEMIKANVHVNSCIYISSNSVRDYMIYKLCKRVPLLLVFAALQRFPAPALRFVENLIENCLHAWSMRGVNDNIILSMGKKIEVVHDGRNAIELCFDVFLPNLGLRLGRVSPTRSRYA